MRKALFALAALAALALASAASAGVTGDWDGTLTILVLGTCNDVVSGPDGKAIARNPGQVRVFRTCPGRTSTLPALEGLTQRARRSITAPEDMC